jgi:hypothetical protein
LLIHNNKTITTTKTPKKSTWRDEPTNTSKQETEQTNRQTNKQKFQVQEQ